MAKFKDYILGVANAIAFTTSVWWILIFLIVTLIWSGVTPVISFLCIMILAAYSWYLWKCANDASTNFAYDYINIEDISNVEEMQRSLKLLKQQWITIGSPLHLVTRLNLIQFLYALLPWRYYDAGAYDALVDACNQLYDPSSNTFVKDRQNILQQFSITFSTYPHYGEAFERLNALI